MEKYFKTFEMSKMLLIINPVTTPKVDKLKW